MAENKPIFLDRVRAVVAGNERVVTPFGPVPAGGLHTGWGQSMKEIVQRAVPFVIDDDAVRKAQELRNEYLMDPKRPLVDLALVPFQETWIEYNPRAKTMPDHVSSLTAEHYGHLIIRSDEDGVSVLTFESWGKRLMMEPYIVNWTQRASLIAPWRFLIGGHSGEEIRLEEEKADLVRQQLLTGQKWLPSWANRVGGDMVNPNPSAGFSPMDLSKGWLAILKENRSTISLLMSILALIAWCPCEVIERKPKGMFLHERKPRAYLEHKLVKLHIPIKVVYQYVKRAHAEIIRKRRHRVREHFRVYHAGTKKEKRVLVHEHMRGDATLGYVQQGYEVTT